MDKITITREDFAKAVSTATLKWMKQCEDADAGNDVSVVTSMQNMLFASLLKTILFDEKENDNKEEDM